MSIIITQQGIARKFNKLQQASSQSLVELRPSYNRKTTRRCPPRPKSSEGQNVVQTAPLLAGAMLQLQEGGSFTSIRGPPLRSKGLPFGRQVNDGLSRSAKERRFMGKSHSSSGRRAQQSPNGHPIELTAEAKADFSIKVSKRDDILQVTSSPALLLSAQTDLVVTL